jgi:hypothetical protein
VAVKFVLVLQTALGLKDRLTGHADSSANPLAVQPSFELSFSKPTLFGKHSLRESLHTPHHVLPFVRFCLNC